MRGSLSPAWVCLALSAIVGLLGAQSGTVRSWLEYTQQTLDPLDAFGATLGAGLDCGPALALARLFSGSDACGSPRTRAVEPTRAVVA